MKLASLVRGFSVASLMFVGSLVGAGSAVAAPAPSLVYVNNTGAPACSAAGPGTQAKPFCTIQEGVSAVATGGTVKVSKGTYSAAVDVTKSVTLKGAKAGIPATSDRTVAANETKVNGGGTNGVTLNANNITVDGFMFDGNAAAPGMSTSVSGDYSGFTIKDNIFSNNVMGLYLSTDGTIASNVSQNRFDSNNMSGASSGNGIYSDQGSNNVQVDHNQFKNQDNAAMVFLSAANSGVRADHNTFNGPGAYLIMYNGQNIWFDHNAGSGFDGASAVYLGGDNDGVRIDHNNLSGTPSSYSGVRIDTGTTPNNNVQVDHNTIQNFGDAGILVGSVPGPASTLTNGEINHNTVNNNGTIYPDYDGGIYIRDGNSGNNIHNNNMSGNTFFDAQDDNTPGDNTWVNNNCDTSNPAGLCTP